MKILTFSLVLFFAVLCAAQNLNVEQSFPAGATEVLNQNQHVGLWQRFQSFYRQVWRPFISDRLMRLRPQPQAPVARRSLVDDVESGEENRIEEEIKEAVLSEEEQRELKFKKLNSPATRYTENASEFSMVFK